MNHPQDLVFIHLYLLFASRLLNNIATLMSNGTGEDLWKFLETVYKSPVPIPGSSISIPVPNSKVVNHSIGSFLIRRISYVFVLFVFFFINNFQNFVCQSPKQFQLPSIPENVSKKKR